ncbi:MAG: penicillin acylase family protein [Vicinamibacteria bacterium]
MRATRAGLCAAALLLAVAPATTAREPVGAVQQIGVRGLARPVEILVDRWGVPHVFGSSEDDAFFGQGFAAARDRLFQIDLWRRRGLGRLAEVFGPEFVEQDRAARLFLYRGDMEQEWRAYSPQGGLEARRIATAFTSGVNAYVEWLAAHPERLPWEFRRMGYEPARWEPEDVVRIRSHGLTRNLTSEVARAGVACRASLDADAVRLRLDPPRRPAIPEGIDPCLPKDLLRVFELATRGVRLGAGGGEARGTGAAGVRAIAEARPGTPSDALEGSNNWTLAGSRTTTGRPILANDPHRAYQAPSLRYISHLSAPGLDVIGAGEPALPGISIGHNGTIAFGLTIFAIDQEDLYVYALDPADPRRYRYRDGFERMRVVKETIAVRGASPVEADLLFTRHGPVIFADGPGRRAFAVRSVWFEPGTAPYFGSVGYMRARDFGQFRAALRRWGAPTENQVYADAAGNIGWVAGGLAPIRPNWDGLLPVPGDGRYEWAGFRDGDELPRALNPEQGFVATANEMNLTPSSSGLGLGFEWANPSRKQRVDELLSGAPKLSVEEALRFQSDQLSIPARRMLAVLRAIEGEGLRAALSGLGEAEPRAARARALLASWDAVESVDSAAAALYEVWFGRHLSAAVKRALAPDAGDAFGRPDVAVVLDAVETPDARLGDAAARDRLVVETLAAAWTETESLLGGDASSWAWGRLLHNVAEHPFSGLADETVRGKLDVGPLPRGGSGYTVNAAGYRASDFRQTGGPSFRIVVDVGSWDASRAINHPGQSGDPLSPHYRDLAGLWSRGESFPLLYSRTAIEKETQVRIRLVPAR